MRRRHLPFLLGAALVVGRADAGPPPSSGGAAATTPKPSKATPQPPPAKPAAPAPPVAAPGKASSSAPKPAPKAGAKAQAKSAGPAKPFGKPKAVALKAGWAPPGYVSMVKQWHAPAAKAPLDGSGRPKLVLVSINRGERVELEPLGDGGGFSPLARERASWILRARDGAQHPVDPRLLDLVYALQRKFGAGEIRFLSGFRTPKRPGSNHGFGRALDLVVPGATDEQVATYARSLGFVGVGIYPTSGFVHLDVRDRSFFWVDRSGPGKPNKTVSILAGDAAASDLHARAAGLVGSAPAVIGHDVDAALAARAKSVTGAQPAQPAAPHDAGDDADDDHDHDHDS